MTRQGTCANCGQERWIRAEGKCKTCLALIRQALGEEIVSVHGYAGYSNGCRCEICRDAKAAYMRERRSSAYLTATSEPVPGVTHGTRSAYEESGCRCPECMATQAQCSRHPRRESAA